MIIQNSGIFYQFLIVFILGENLNSEKCALDLNSYIEKNLKPYQVVLLTNSDIDSTAEQLIRKVLRNLPFLQINLEKMSANDLEKLSKSPPFGILRKTSLFLLVNSSHNSSNITPAVNYLTNLSPGKVRPNVLLIAITNRKSSFETFLQKMWLRQFLDFTILEVINHNQELHSLKMELLKTFVHFYTPFTNSYERRKCSSRTNWFANKLLNLHGYPIIAGLALRPPYSLVKYDKSGRLISQNGADLETFKALTRAMNFSPIIDSNANSAVGVFQGKRATGMLGKLIDNKISLLITSVLNFRPNADGALYGYSSNIEMERFVALVPITHNRNQEMILNLKIMYIGTSLFVAFVLFVWSGLRKYPYERNFWQMENIAALLLGVTINYDKPTFVFNRLAFLYLCALGICFSSHFLGGLTAGHVKETEEVQYNSFKDLGNSNLVPMIHPNFFNMCLDDSAELRKLKANTISTELMDILCPVMLLQYRNVTCLLMNAYAQQLVQVMRDSSGLPIAKILHQSLFTARRTLALEKNSPLKERIDQVVTILTESGLRLRWSNNITDQEFFASSSSKIDMNKSMNIGDLGAVSQLVRILFFVTLPGYLLSISIFLAEVFHRRIGHSKLLEKLLKS